MRCIKKCTSMLHILCKFLKTANIPQCTVCFLQSAMNTTAQFADMIPYLATIMHCRCQLCTALLQTLPDGRASCNELMLHHASASCRMLQIPSNFAADTTQLRDSNSKRPTYGTPILSHRGAFIKTCFHTGIYTYTCFGMVLHAIPSCAGVFTQGCFYTQKHFYTRTRGHFYTQMPLHSNAFTEECFYTHVCLHRVSFDTSQLLHTGD